MKVRLPIFSGNLTFINRCKYLYTRHLRKISKCRLFRLKTLERLFLLRHTVLTDDLTAICHAHCIVDVEGVHKRLLEPVIVLVLRLAPLNLAECGHSREQHILQVLCSSDILSPQVSLYTEDMLLSLLRDISIWLPGKPSLSAGIRRWQAAPMKWNQTDNSRNTYRY